MNEKLKLCPFCGSEAKVIINNCYTDIHSVICKNCFAESDRYHTQEEAIRQWNTRKPIEVVVSKMETEINKINTKLTNDTNTVDMLALCSRRQAFYEAISIVERCSE